MPQNYVFMTDSDSDLPYDIADARGIQVVRMPYVIDGKEYGVKVNEFIFIVELDGLNGRDRLAEIAPVHSIAHI